MRILVVLERTVATTIAEQTALLPTPVRQLGRQRLVVAARVCVSSLPVEVLRIAAVVATKRLRRPTRRQ